MAKIRLRGDAAPPPTPPLISPICLFLPYDKDYLQISFSSLKPIWYEFSLTIPVLAIERIKPKSIVLKEVSKALTMVRSGK